MSAEQDSRILDEHCIGIIGELGQADHVEAGITQCLLIGMVLSGGPDRIDRRAIEMGEGTFGKARAHGPGEGEGHGGGSVRRGSRAVEPQHRLEDDLRWLGADPERRNAVGILH